MRAPDGTGFDPGERFELVRRIGEGGMGIVYEALDRRSNERVALKTLRFADSESLYRFKREFRSLADVSHPNVVTIHELFVEGREAFLTMELVDGVDFLSHVRRGSDIALAATRDDLEPDAPCGSSNEIGTLDAEALVDALRQLAMGIAAVHAAGKLHRDIKPGNVRVAADGRVVLLDFGLIGDVDQGVAKWSADRIAGTAEYMAPEQGTGAPIGPAADWYAFGVLLFEALTGELPFIGPWVSVLVKKHEEDAPRASTRSSEVAPFLDELTARLLSRTPADRPSAEDILLALGAPRAVRRSLQRGRAEVFGRDAEVAAIHTALAALDSGKTVLVRVSGPSGIGKTTLVRHALDAVDRDGQTVVLVGRCLERDAAPYKAIDSLVDSLSRYLVGLPPDISARFLPRGADLLVKVFPVLERVEALARVPTRARPLPTAEPHEIRRLAFAALRDLLARIGDEMRLIVWIDDLQWGDVDSAVLIADLLRPPDAPRVAFIASHRADGAEPSPTVDALVRAAQALGQDLATVSIDLGALSFSAARQLAASLVDDAEEAERIATEASGVPFLIDALIRHREARRLRGSYLRPASLEDAILDELTMLDTPAQRLMMVLSLAGGPLPRRAALDAAGVSPAEGARIVRALANDRWLRTAVGEALETSHDRIRETLRATLAGPARLELHHQIAEALERSGASHPDELAMHFAAAGFPVEAARYARLAGERATASLAFDRAAHWYRVALGGDWSKREVQDLRIALADALRNGGRGSEAADEYLAAAHAEPDLEQAERLQFRGGSELLRVGRLRAGTEALAELLERHGVTLPRTRWGGVFAMLWVAARFFLRGMRFNAFDPPDARRSRAADLCWAVIGGTTMTDVLVAGGMSFRQALLALDSGCAERATRALCHHAGWSSAISRRAAERTLARASEMVRRHPTPFAEAYLIGIRGGADFMDGRFETATTLLDQAIRQLRDSCPGSSWEARTMETFSLWSLFYRGKLKELSERSALLRREAVERGDLLFGTQLRLGMLTTPALIAGDPAAARRENIEAIEQWDGPPGGLPGFWSLVGRCHVDLYEGKGVEASSTLVTERPLLKRSFALEARFNKIEVHQLAARCALAAWDETGNEMFLRRAAVSMRRLRRFAEPWARALCSFVEAAIAHARGLNPRAIELLHHGIARCADADMGVYAVVARRRLGTLLRDEGAQLRDQADEELATNGVVDPDRWSRVLLPGFR